MEVLSEHQCQGWLEGYLLTGQARALQLLRGVHPHRRLDVQPAREVAEGDARRSRGGGRSRRSTTCSRRTCGARTTTASRTRTRASSTTSSNKKAEIIRVYLPPDANCLLSVADHCLRSRHYVNVDRRRQAAGAQLPLDGRAVLHCTRGIGIWEWASNDDGDPDVVMACCGDIPTLETLAAVDILRRELPELKVRVVNVVDLMRLQPDTEHPHGLSDREFDTLFTTDRPVVFAYHGYPWLIHRLTYRRTNHANIHVRGYKEEGTTTTPFDMVMLNDLDRFHLVMDVIDRVPALGSHAAHAAPADGGRARAVPRVHARSRARTRPTIRDWTWPQRERPVRVLVVNAGSSSLKLSRARRRRRGRSASVPRRAAGRRGGLAEAIASRAGRRRRPPRRPRRHGVRRARR